MKSRTRARGIALQALYEMDLSTHLPGDILNNRLEASQLDPTHADFARSIIFGVIKLIPDLDLTIAKHAPEWPLDQVAIIDRNILRIALWEMIFDPSTPIKVVINEAIELAKLFGSDATPRFVNGVLGSLVDNQNEIRQFFEKKKDLITE